MNSVIFKFLMMAALMTGLTQTVSAAPGRGRAAATNPAATVVKIALVHAPGILAKGSAKIKNAGNEQEFSVEAQVPRRLAGSVLGVTVNDTVVGTMTVNTFGAAKLTLNSQLGQNVPAISAGTLIGVVNASGGILLAGKF